MESNHNRLVQFNGEMIDFQLNLDVDHRKRRRNRTTQSCLNCHTSKRKCDRKRPCSRCIQLGLTGLCVYEVDDPAIRDDPNVDEITKLRNRIAELESLVRELRGKPHPRWVDAGQGSNTGSEGDLSDKWHTRAHKKPAIAIGSQMSVKMESEPFSDLSYHQYQHRHHHQQLSLQQRHHDNHQQGQHYSPSPPLSMAPSSGSSSSPPRDEIDSAYYPHHDFHTSSNGSSCHCIVNPVVAPHLLSLTQQLQSIYAILNRLPEHNSEEGCLVLDRIAALNNFLQLHQKHEVFSYQQHVGGNAQAQAHHHHLQSNNPVLGSLTNQQHFSPLPSPHSVEFDHFVHHSPHHFAGPGGTPDSELMRPESTSSSGSTFSPCHQQQTQLGSPWYQAVSSPNSSAGINGLGHGPGYNPYFPVSPGVNGSPHSLQQQQQHAYEVI